MCEGKNVWPGFPILIIRLIPRFGKLFDVKKPLEEQFFGIPPFLEQQ
jgi:hypothetical protein